MDEQRLERLLRAGPPFATTYVARPLALEPPRVASLGVRRLALVLAVMALLLAGTIVGALLSGVLRGPQPNALVVRDPGGGISYTISILYSDGQEKLIYPLAPAKPVWLADIAWSNSGDQLAFIAGERGEAPVETFGLYLVRLDGTDLRELVKRQPLTNCPSSRLASMRWSPDDTAILICRDRGTAGNKLAIINAASGEEVVLAKGSALEYFAPFKWSPSGEWVAYWTHKEQNAVWVVRADGSGGSGGEPLAVPSETPGAGDGAELREFAWDPRSEAVAFGDRHDGAAVIRIAGLDRQERSVLLPSLSQTEGVPQVLAWTTDDELIYMSGDGRLVAAISTDGSDPRVLLDRRSGAAPLWMGEGDVVDWTLAPWITPDGGVQWWEPGLVSSTCLMAVKDAAPQILFCVDGLPSPLAGSQALATSQRR